MAAPVASVADYRARAKRRLPNMLFEYLDGGAYSETTLARNVTDLEALPLRQRVMRDTRKLDLETTILGQRLAMPLALAPVGMAGMFRRRGEVQASRAAEALGIPFCLSTVGVCSVEEVAATGRPPWFQLYMLRDRGYMVELLARARAAGCPALVFTVDLPTPGARHRDIRSGFTGASGMSSLGRRALDGISHPQWLWDVWLHGRPHALGNVAAALQGRQQVSDFLAWLGRNFDRSMTWADLDWLRQHWSGPIIIKGVLDPADARDAVSAGAQALIVSNHGGRQLDGVRSSISALPRIADAVGGEVDLMMDGGVRSGLDVLRALALGAKACLIGRPWVYAMAAGGEPALTRMLTTLRSELCVAMILTGCVSVRDADRTLLDFD